MTKEKDKQNKNILGKTERVLPGKVGVEGDQIRIGRGRPTLHLVLETDGIRCTTRDEDPSLHPQKYMIRELILYGLVSSLNRSDFSV